MVLRLKRVFLVAIVAILFALAGCSRTGVCDSAIDIYPNPATSNIIVHSTMNDVHGTGVIEVFDNIGVLQQTFQWIPNQSININVSNLAAGMYSVRMRTDNCVATNTFVKL